MNTQNHRKTIHLLNCEILNHQHFNGDQHLLRLHAPEIAIKAKAGSFVHVTTDPALPLRRPISIMRVSLKEGWIDLLYKVFGEGTRRLSKRNIGEKLSVMGPIGNQFETHIERPRTLMIGGGVGMPPMIFLSEQIRQMEGIFKPFVILGSEVPFPFNAQPSRLLIPSIPTDVIATMPLLEDWGIPCRLASTQGFPGVYNGYVTDLARVWLSSLSADQLKEVEIFSCGPHPMLAAVAEVAREYNVPCQVSMEEFMACGVGGCAGCVVEVNTKKGPAMKRVCVDGPVFDAQQVF